MKTDIFKDLVPLLTMDNNDISVLAEEIVNENTSDEDYNNLIELLFKINRLKEEIINEYKYTF